MFQKSKSAEYIKDYSLKSIGIIIFLIILSYVMYSEVLSKIMHINKIGFLIALLLTIPILFLRSYRWNVIKHLHGVYYSAKESFLIYLVGILTNVCTTRHYSDDVKTKYIREKGYPHGDVYLTIIVERIIDVFVLLFFFFIGIIIFMKRLPLGWVYYVLVFLLLILIVMMVLSGIVYRKYLRNLIYIVIHIFVPDRYRYTFQKNIEEFFKKAKRSSRKNYRNVMLFSVVSWLLYFIQAYIFSVSLGIDISFFYLIAALAISSLITLLPISVFGIGTRDLIFMLVLLSFGYSAVDALALSLCILITFIFGVLLGSLAFFFRPIKL